MDSDKAKSKSKTQGFDCVMKPVPPGRKARARLWRPGDPEPSALRLWLLIGAVVTGALVLGLVIGRFILP